MLDLDTWLPEVRLRVFMLAAFVVIGLLAAADIVADAGEGAKTLHIILEGIVVIVSLFSALAITLRLIKEAGDSRRVIREMSEELQHNREQAAQWRNETQSLLRGLGASINKQFERWRLSPGEKEIALFLLKGLSHKEVASLRGVSEATARQQAGAVYKKAGLSGRHDLAAFFLEELALPIEEDRAGSTKQRSEVAHVDFTGT